MRRALYRMGRFAARRPWAVIGTWLVAVLVVIGASGTMGKTLEDSFEVPGLDSQGATELLAGAGSDRAGVTAQVVVTPDDPEASFLRSSSARAELAEVRRRIAELPNVIAVSDPLAYGGAGQVSDDGRVAVLRVQYPQAEEIGVAELGALKDARASLDQGPLQVEAGGELFFTFEEAGSGIGEMVGVVIAAIILLVAFGSFLAMGLPIGIALAGLGLGISAMPLVAFLVDIPSWAPQMATMVGIGVGIDYALFLVTRHRENLAAGMSVTDSVGHAVATAGQAVIFAGGTVVIAILGMAVAGIPFMTAAGIATAIIVGVMVAASVTLLPALLGLAGQRIRGRRRRGPPAQPSARWMRWGEHVSRHARAYAVGVTLGLVALTAPVMALNLGTPDEGNLPDSRTERRAYDLAAAGFGPGVNGPITVAVDTSRDAGAAVPLAAALAADPGIASVAEPEVNATAGVATIVALPTTSPQDEATQATIARLRDALIPGALDGRDARAHVGGMTANWSDIGQKVSDRLPYFIAAVVVGSFLLLMLVFRSVLVPLKAALLNLLSIGAAYGVLVVVFQWGVGLSLVGLEETVPVVPFIPMFMFAVLFGLSMDYEVFLLSRIREEYLATGDNGAAVIRGIAGTARVITSAAAIMVAVFMGFVFGEDPAIKMVGLGLATAILVDATVVRLVLVPATMKLLGERNWWLPGWLDRVLPHLDRNGEVHAAPAPVDVTAEPQRVQA